MALDQLAVDVELDSIETKTYVKGASDSTFPETFLVSVPLLARLQRRPRKKSACIILSKKSELFVECKVLARRERDLEAPVLLELLIDNLLRGVVEWDQPS